VGQLSKQGHRTTGALAFYMIKQTFLLMPLHLHTHLLLYPQINKEARQC